MITNSPIPPRRHESYRVRKACCSRKDRWSSPPSKSLDISLNGMSLAFAFQRHAAIVKAMLTTLSPSRSHFIGRSPALLEGTSLDSALDIATRYSLEQPAKQSAPRGELRYRSIVAITGVHDSLRSANTRLADVDLGPGYKLGNLRFIFAAE